MSQPLLLGAVAYDPKVVTIWDGFQRWFAQRGLPFDYVLYTNYERQVAQHAARAIDVAWNSPLAWLQAEAIAAPRGLQARALAMRDTDQDLTTVTLVRAAAPYRSLADLRGATIGVGASDSPQATLLPLLHLAEAGVAPERDCQVRRFDVLVGKHGDHIGGEREAARALLNGTVDAACVLDANSLLFARDGTLPAGSVRVLATTPTFDHCNFTWLGTGTPPARVQRFTELLLSMSYDDPEVRPLLDLEGLRAWRPGRTSGYAALARACARFGALQPFLQQMAAS